MSNRKFIVRYLLFICSFGVTLNACASKPYSLQTKKAPLNNEYVELSIDLITAVKNGKSTKKFQAKLEVIPLDSLAKYLATEEQKKAFWINMYNAFVQIKLSEKPEYYKDRGAFFKTPLMIIAGRSISFDDIEHGIIRGSKIKLSLGLIKDPFVSEYERKLRCSKEDGRVHFALNCGATSCPLIAIYDAEHFDEKIDRVAKNFLNKVSTFKKDENKVSTTPLFSWFRGDFNGKNGILKLLANYGVIPEKTSPKIEYTNYDWTLSLGNYYEE